MMTTSGFISPAREGKLPDSKAPFIQSYDYPKPPPKEPILIPPSAPPPPVAENHPEKPTKKKKPTEKKDKVSKDLFKTKVEPMGPPPPKQMPPLAAIIFPPSDSPMAAVVEQQQSQKRKSNSKERKHKQKETNKELNKSGEGKASSKKKKKQLVAKVEKPWSDNLSMAGIAPIVPIYSAPPPFNDTQIKTERPITPDIPKDMLLLSSDPKMPPLFNLPAGTTGTLTPIGQQPSTSSFLNTTTPNPYEGKISSEPDKHKMNIFKRISSSKNKDEIVKSMLPPNINLPETSIFPIDDSPYQQPLPPIKNHTSPRKQNFSHLPFKTEEQPLNMSMPKQLEHMQSFDLTTSPTGSPVASPSHFIPTPIEKPKKEPKPKKVREKKPPKVREKKIKHVVGAPDWSNIMHPDGMPGSMAFPPMQLLSAPPKPVPQKKIAGHLPPTLGNIDDEFNSMSHLMGPVPWFPGGAPGLIPMAPMLSGPGLIPNPEFFPGFPMHGYPFGGPASIGHMPAFGMPNPNMRPDYPIIKRTRIDEVIHQTPSNAPIEMEKVKCNVAPLVPESLKLSDELEIIATENINPHKSRSLPINHPPKPQISPVMEKPFDPTNVPQQAIPLSSHKRRRSTMSPPKTPIIDLDVQSISDDELPDDMDLEDISPDNSSTQPEMATQNEPIASTPIAIEKKDKSAAKLEKKREKENRKKDKEGKIKKKKDKKNKSKGLEKSEKSEKRKGKEEKKRDKEAKERLKKEKREKKREKERLSGLAAGGALDPGSIAAKLEGVARHGFGDSLGPDGDGHAAMAAAAVPKLTLKLGQSPRPITPELHRKM